MTRKFRTLILILIATIALSGCANDDGIYSDKGQVFRKILSSDLTSLDTSLITDEISSESDCANIRRFIHIRKR